MTLEELYCGPVAVLKKAEVLVDPHSPALQPFLARRQWIGLLTPILS